MTLLYTGGTCSRTSIRPQRFSWKALLGTFFGDCQLWLFADADHAGEFDSKSTSSGCAMFLVGPNTFFPLNAANHALRAEGIPMLALMEQLGIFKKLSQKAGVKAKPGIPEPEDPVFTLIDKEIDKIRYGKLRGASLRRSSTV